MRFKLFLSRTSADLGVEYSEAVKKVLRKKFDVIEQTAFGARPTSPTATSVGEVEKADVFVGIYAFRYGNVPPGAEKSITEQELDGAEKLDLDRFCFIASEDADPSLRQHQDEDPVKREKLRELKERIERDLSFAPFRDVGELVEKVEKDLFDWHEKEEGRRRRPDDEKEYLELADQEYNTKLRRVYPEYRLAVPKKRRKPGSVTPDEIYREDAHVVDREEDLPPETSIYDVFDKVGGRLLILGEPASGKTWSLVDIASRAVYVAMRRGDKPMPVLLRLAEWQPVRFQRFRWRKEHLSKWIVKKMSKSARPKSVSGWLEKNKLLLLLDGLDDVRPRENMIRCIEAINRFYETRRQPQMAVCVRTRAYEEIVREEKLRLALWDAVVLQPLGLDDVQRHFEQSGPEFAVLADALANDENLREVAGSPLMVNLMSYAFRGVEAMPLGPQASEEDWRRAIFDRFLERALQEKEYPLEKSLRWLSWLARRLTKPGGRFFLEGIQPSWLTRGVDRWAYALGSRLAGGLLLGLAAGLDGAAAFGLAVAGSLGVGILDGLRFNLGSGPGKSELVLYPLAVAVMMALAGWVTSPLRPPGDNPLTISILGWMLWGFFTWRGIRRTADDDVRFLDWRLRWSWRGAQLGLLPGVAVGIFLWSAAHELGVVLVRFAAVPVAWVGFLVGGLLGRDFQPKTRPYSQILDSARNALLAGLVVLFTSAALLLVLSGFDLESPIIRSTEWVVIPAVLVALGYGLLDVVQHGILRALLIRREWTPRHYVRFLDFAAQRRVLQTDGRSYLFVHDLLREHLASCSSPRTEATSRP